MEDFKEGDSKVKKLFDGSYDLEQKLADGSIQLSNITKYGMVIENSGGVSSVDLERGVFNLSSLKNVDVTSNIREEIRIEGDFEIHRYFFSEDSWAEIKFKAGSVQDIKTNNVVMTLSEKGAKLTITAPPENK